MLGEMNEVVKSNEELIELANKKISEGAKVMSLKEYFASAEEDEEKHIFDPIAGVYSTQFCEDIFESMSDEADVDIPYAVFGCSETMYDYIDEPYYSKNPASILTLLICFIKISNIYIKFNNRNIA